METVIFGTEQDCRELLDAIRAIPENRRPNLKCTCLNDYDDLRRELAEKRYKLLIVTADGARGMEACLGARKIRPRIPLFWFSNDRAFGPQSYRMDCTYFAAKPVPEHRLCSAFERLGEAKL